LNKSMCDINFQRFHVSSVVDYKLQKILINRLRC
jgi:hypothetical protein